MRQKPIRRGFERVSESYDTRSLGKQNKDPKVGHTCTSCGKFFNYLTASNRVCIGCKKRSR